MNTTEPHSNTLNHEQLIQIEPAPLLTAFVDRFNDLQSAAEAMHIECGLLRLKINDLERSNQSKAELLDDLRQENAQLHAIASEADKLTNTLTGALQERDQLRLQLKSTQQELNKLKGGDSPKRLREQIKRLKAANTKHQARNDELEKRIKVQRQEAQQEKEKLNLAITKISEQKQQLTHQTGTGLYHNGPHHLIIWPQLTKMARSDGSTFTGQSLLYIHQSGRGGLITFEPNSPDDGVRLCAAPKGGLNPSKAVLEFAQNWLYKVNHVQDGKVNIEDMLPVNYNGEEKN